MFHFNFFYLLEFAAVCWKGYQTHMNKMMYAYISSFGTSLSYCGRLWIRTCTQVFENISWSFFISCYYTFFSEWINSLNLLRLCGCCLTNWCFWSFFHFSFLSNWLRALYWSGVDSKLSQIRLVSSTGHCSLEHSPLLQAILGCCFSRCLVGLKHHLSWFFICNIFSYFLGQIKGI